MVFIICKNDFLGGGLIEDLRYTSLQPRLGFHCQHGACDPLVDICKRLNFITMFYFIGLGLGDAKDITVKGLEVVKRAERVYLEAYTSILTSGKEELVSVMSP